jgi:hypothetical protein
MAETWAPEQNENNKELPEGSAGYLREYHRGAFAKDKTLVAKIPVFARE